MSQSEGVFYAYARSDDYSPGHLLCFVSRDAADTWWRKLQEQRYGDKTQRRSWGMRRLSPQCYFFGGFTTWLHQRGGPTSPSSGLVIHAMELGDQTTPRLLLSPSPRTDYLNGKSYYIRSRAQPEYYWFAQDFGAHGTYKVILSKGEKHTRFIIRRTQFLPWHEQCKPEEDVLIESDIVVMSAVLDNGVTPMNKGSANPPKLFALLGAATAFEFDFGLLTSGKGFGYNLKEYDDSMVFRGSGLGDRWDLVD